MHVVPQRFYNVESETRVTSITRVPTGLTHATVSPMAPAWYMIAATIAAQIALMLRHENAPLKTAQTNASLNTAILSV